MDHPPINLWDRELTSDIVGLIGAFEGDDESRVLVLSSANPDFFIAHADVGMILEMDPAVQGQEGAPAPVNLLLGRLHASPKISIALLRGVARGGGSEIALSCDLRFASPRAVLAQPEVALGIIPGAGGTQRLTLLVGRARALEIVVGCGDVSAEEAAAMGYVNRVLADDQIEGHVRRLASRIASMPPAAAAGAKRAVDAAFGDPTEGFAAEASAFPPRSLTPWPASACNGSWSSAGRRRRSNAATSPTCSTSCTEDDRLNDPHACVTHVIVGQRCARRSIGSVPVPAVVAKGSRSGSVTRRRCAASTSRSSAPPCSGCSARTARARPRPCASSPRCCKPDAGRAVIDGIDVVARAAAGPGAHRPHRPVRGGRRAADRASRTSSTSAACSTCPSATPGRRADELLERFDLVEPRDRVVKQLLGRHAAPARHRDEPHRAAVGAVPRRAHDRPRPAEPAGDVGAHRGAGRRGGTTTLLTTQYLDEADRLADEIMVIDHGAVIARGTPTS